MKLDLETGLANFLTTAFAAAPEDAAYFSTLDIVPGSGESTLENGEHHPVVIVLIEDQPNTVGTLYLAQANILTSTPAINGRAADHQRVCALIESILPPPVAPYQGPNTGLISVAIAAATSDLYTCNGYSVQNAQATTEADRWKANYRITLGLQRNNPSPLEAEEEITFS